MKNNATGPASALIDARIKELVDWRGKTLAKVHAILHEADPSEHQAVGGLTERVLVRTGP